MPASRRPETDLDAAHCDLTRNGLNGCLEYTPQRSHRLCELAEILIDLLEHMVDCLRRASLVQLSSPGTMAEAELLHIGNASSSAFRQPRIQPRLTAQNVVQEG